MEPQNFNNTTLNALPRTTRFERFKEGRGNDNDRPGGPSISKTNAPMANEIIRNNRRSEKPPRTYAHRTVRSNLTNQFVLIVISEMENQRFFLSGIPLHSSSLRFRHVVPKTWNFVFPERSGLVIFKKFATTNVQRDRFAGLPKFGFRQCFCRVTDRNFEIVLDRLSTFKKTPKLVREVNDRPVKSFSYH